MTYEIQQELRFWTDEKGPCTIERKWRVDPSNSDCPFSKFIGNERAVKRLGRAAFAALGRINHVCSDFSFAIFGPASTGKTLLAKLFAETIQLPLVEIQPQSVDNITDLFEEIRKVCDNTHVSNGETETSLTLIADRHDRYILPPVVVFIDEVHNLKKSVVQGLLKAVEHTDRMMITDDGTEVNTANVCWVIATTDRGELFDAFDTRFVKVNLRLYSKSEVAEIVSLSNPDWDDEVCELVAHYCGHVPREALAFARDMRVEREMNNGSWSVVAGTVADDHGIDPLGMTYQRLNILKALGQHAVPVARLTLIAQVKEEELRKYIMPPLLAVTPDQPIPLVTVTSKGYTITPAGLEALDRRGIENKGVDAMPLPTRELYQNYLPGHVPVHTTN